MKKLTVFILILLLIGCTKKPDGEKMSFKMLANGWHAGEIVEHSSIYGEPPATTESSEIIIFGMHENDKAHRLYKLPADTPVSDIVTYFKVGSHGANSYGFDIQQTIKLVSEKVSKIDAIIPCRVIFADAAGLKMKFKRQITDIELSKIETLFTMEEAMQTGLDRYISSWDGSQRLLGPLMKENMIHLWWD